MKTIELSMGENQANLKVRKEGQSPSALCLSTSKQRLSIKLKRCNLCKESLVNVTEVS